MKIELNENGATVDGQQFETYCGNHRGGEYITIPELNLISYDDGLNWDDTLHEDAVFNLDWFHQGEREIFKYRGRETAPNFPPFQILCK